MDLNKLLKKEIRKAGISQCVLAERMHMSCSSLSRKLNGNRTLYIDEFAQICSVLNLSADNLLEEADA